MELQAKGLRAVVTAGAAGIGRAIAETLLVAGARVHVCDVSAAALDTFATANPGAGASQADVSNPAQVDRLFESAARAFGGLDLLVNNAGIAGPTGRVEDLEPADWDRTLAVNINGQFYCTRRAAPLLKQAGGGSIVNISSAAGRFGFPLRTPYAASKWAIVGFTQSLAIELGPSNIRVNAILPGVVEGERIDRVIEAKAAALDVTEDEMRARMLSNVSLKCMVSAQDIANMVLFLVSSAGRRISGQSLSVDGHLTCLS
jgi:NAD(P)-dependent dehydrogenase (short-subunit alcohol dehydrogenase family)